MFLQPVDPIRDECSDYFDVIKNPMDLGTAMKKLQSDEYQTVEQWKDDINLIWTNTITYNTPKALISTLAKTLQNYFKEETATFSSDSENDWNTEFENLKAQVLNLIKTGPKVVQQKQTKKSQPSNSQPKPPIPRSVSVQPKPIIQPSEPAPSSSTSSSVPYISQKEIIRLSKEIELIEDSSKQDQIISLIKKNEPKYAIGDDEIELNLFKLSPATLTELRSLLNKFQNK
ncbi:Bromodomain containing protein [Histomonas meleagridis]|uniref:Bromodomain containing protein n=1 Tax=Histomonas meleagridis TaxID=135588 RepID=UPI00355A57E1|nr:Bromodomain containing protein [Histomonas meleagridis]KAH0804313.1 Bromodomain containing protein [Histomonas meleagridis]